MAENTLISRRWNGFVCPACRKVFRVVADHDGSGVVCPACRIMLRLPREGDQTPPLVTPGAHRRKRSGKSKRVEGGRANAVFDETFANKTEADTVVYRAVIASVITVIVLLLAGVFWPRSHPETPRSSEIITDQPVVVDVEGESDVPRFVSVETIRDDLEPVAKAFLNATEMEDALRWVSRPGQTRKRMEEHFPKGYRADRFRRVSRQNLGERGEDWARILVEVGDYALRPMWLRKDDGWKVDWESWVGWSPISLDELKEKKPTAPTMFRALVSPVLYYNFRFNDEAAWTCFLLTSPDGKDLIYGYVPRGGNVHTALASPDQAIGSRMLLLIRYPEDPASNNQVLIDEVIGDGWLEFEEPP